MGTPADNAKAVERPEKLLVCQHGISWPSDKPPADDCIWATSAEHCTWVVYSIDSEHHD